MYNDFIKRLKLFISKHPAIVTTTLSNIFTMRLLGNKTHGDLAEIAISEFISQYMYDFRAEHVGKNLFRSKKREEDIRVINEITQLDFPVSLKAYGVGPLQVSTDKSFMMFPRLQSAGEEIVGDAVQEVLADEAFQSVAGMHILPLIYDEDEKTCNILLFDYAKAKKATRRISLVATGNGRKHPVYKFHDEADQYICEVRYGGKTANALQRGLWTHTKNALGYFDSVTGGWISYANNGVLVDLFAHALVSSQTGHEKALSILRQDIEQMKQSENLIL